LVRRGREEKEASAGWLGFKVSAARAANEAKLGRKPEICKIERILS
jgi:hypothetical protein